MRTSLFNTISLEDDVEIQADNTDTSMDVSKVIEQSNQYEEYNKIQVEADKTLETIEKSLEISGDLEKQIFKNEEKLKQEPEKITVDDVEASQEALQVKLAQLGMPLSDISTYRISAESIVANTIQSLCVSTESVKEMVRRIWETIKNLFKKLVENTKIIFKHIKFLFASEEKRFKMLVSEFNGIFYKLTPEQIDKITDSIIKGEKISHESVRHSQDLYEKLINNYTAQMKIRLTVKGGKLSKLYDDYLNAYNNFTNDMLIHIKRFNSENDRSGYAMETNNKLDKFGKISCELLKECGIKEANDKTYLCGVHGRKFYCYQQDNNGKFNQIEYELDLSLSDISFLIYKVMHYRDFPSELEFAFKKRHKKICDDIYNTIEKIMASINEEIIKHIPKFYEKYNADTSEAIFIRNKVLKIYEMLYYMFKRIGHDTRDYINMLVTVLRYIDYCLNNYIIIN